MDQQIPSIDEPRPIPSTDISIWEALGIAWDLLITVLLLTTLFAVAGIFADRYFHTKFLFTAIGFILLILIGRPILLRKAKAVVRRIEGKKPSPKDS
jgi:F0F1-type ATP synthase assembly protein I